METMLHSNDLIKVRNKCGFSQGLCLSSTGNSGGLGLWWRDINVEILTFSEHHVEALIRNDAGIMVWRAIDIYGWPDSVNKFRTWQLMKILCEEGSAPTIMFSDFSEMTSHSEKERGAIRGESQMDAFREAIDSCALWDMGFNGSCFT